MPGTYFKKGSLSEIDLAYLAGILDGEGFIGITKYKKSSCKRGFSYQIRVQVGTKDSVISKECYNITGFGRYHKSNCNTFYWITEANSAYAVLKLVIPYLRLKKKQAQLCIDLYERANSGKRNYLPEEEWAFRDSMYEQCKQLKKDAYAGHVL